MCKCRSLEEHSDRSQYTSPSVGDDVVRFGDDSRVGLLYHVDSYSGGLPRAHVVYDDGDSAVECQFLYPSPAHAQADPCWS